MYAPLAASPSLEARSPPPEALSSGCQFRSRASGSPGSRAARRRSVRPRGLAGDLLSPWAEHVPAGAEVGQALASDVAGLLVAGVEVERVAVVGDLRLAVRPGGGSDERGICPPADGRLARRSQRRPDAGAGTQARALRPRVAPEQIERAALRVDEDRAEL